MRFRLDPHLPPLGDSRSSVQARKHAVGPGALGSRGRRQPLVTHAQARRTRRHPWSHPAPGTGRGNRQTRPFQEPLHASQFLLCFEGLVGTGPPVVIYSPTLAVRALGSCSGHARRRGSPHSPCSRSSAVGACRRWHPRRSCRRRPGSRRDQCSCISRRAAIRGPSVRGPRYFGH